MSRNRITAFNGVLQISLYLYCIREMLTSNRLSQLRGLTHYRIFASLSILLFFPSCAFSAIFDEVPRITVGYYNQFHSGDTTIYDNPNTPCGKLAARVSGGFYNYTNPRGGEKPNYGIGCTFDLVALDGNVYADTFFQGWISEMKGCPDGYSETVRYDSGSPLYSCIRTSDSPPNRCNGNDVGNPVLISVGIKYQSETDMSASGASQLGMQRTYLSKQAWGPLFGRFGYGWHDSYQRSVFYAEDENISTLAVTTAFRPNGTLVQFALIGDEWVSNEDIDDRLIWVRDASGITIGWEYIVAKNGAVETYDKDGKLQSIAYRSGNVSSLYYSNATTQTGVALASGLLIRVENSTGRFIDFSYDDQGRIVTMINQAGQVWGYRYDSLNNLQYVDNPDSTTEQYHYEDTTYPNALTGITDERGIRYATWGYDAQGRANLSTHAGNAQRVDITYDDTDDSRTVTNSRGVSSTYGTISQLGIGFVKGISGPGCSASSNGNTDYVYDPATNDLLSKADNGITTQYGNYDSKGQYGYKIEAVGTPEERRTDYTYDPRYNNKITAKVEMSVATGNSKTTTYTYDGFGNHTSVTVDGFRPDGTAVSRTTTYQYNAPLNQLSQIDGPRTDVTDVTTLDYYANDAIEGFNRGRLQRITGPAGVVLRDNMQYTATGKVLSEERPNGLSLAYTYYAGNDRLETLTETGGGISRTTRWTYLATGEVETITQADGTPTATTTRLYYDDARRLVGLSDQLGNHIDYVLDPEWV